MTTKKAATAEVATVDADAGPAAPSFPSRYSEEFRQKDRESCAKLLNPNVTLGAGGLSPEEFAAKYHTVQGDAPETGYRPTMLNSYTAQHIERMVTAGREALGLGEHADAARIAEHVQRSTAAMLDERTISTIDEAHVSERRLMVATGEDGFGSVKLTPVTLRFGKDPSMSDGDAVNQRIDAEREMLLGLDLGSYGRSTLQAIDRVAAQLAEVQGFDAKTGEPIMRYSGKARITLESQLFNLKRSSRLEAVTSALAYQLKKEHVELTAAQEAEDAAAVETKAEEIVRAQRIETAAVARAKQLAAKGLYR